MHNVSTMPLYIQPATTHAHFCTAESLLQCCMIRQNHPSSIRFKVDYVHHFRKMQWQWGCYDTVVRLGGSRSDADSCRMALRLYEGWLGIGTFRKWIADLAHQGFTLFPGRTESSKVSSNIATAVEALDGFHTENSTSPIAISATNLQERRSCGRSGTVNRVPPLEMRDSGEMMGKPMIVVRVHVLQR